MRQQRGDVRGNAPAGQAISERGRRRKWHSGWSLRRQQFPGGREQGLPISRDQAGGATGQRFRSLGILARHQNRHAQVWRFFLDATGIGDDQGRRLAARAGVDEQALGRPPELVDRCGRILEVDGADALVAGIRPATGLPGASMLFWRRGDVVASVASPQTNPTGLAASAAAAANARISTSATAIPACADSS